jgi:hypothetical protein
VAFDAANAQRDDDDGAGDAAEARKRIVLPAMQQGHTTHTAAMDHGGGPPRVRWARLRENVQAALSSHHCQPYVCVCMLRRLW